MQSVESEDRRTWALVRAMRYFPERLFENVFLLARTMRDVTNFSVVICNVIPLVRPDFRDELLREQLTIARSETRENVRAFTLGRVARYLPYELVEEALEIAWTIEFHGDRSVALIPLISRLAELGYAKKALKILASLEEPEKSSAMLEIIPHLSQQVLLNKVMSDPQRLCLSVLIKLVPYLPQSQRGELIKEILRVSRIIGDSNFRNQTLVNLAPYLPKEILGEILVLVRTMDPKWERVELLSQLALCMTEAYRHKILTEALHTVRLIDFEPRKGSSLAKLAPYLSVELIEIAYEIALEIEDPIECAETLMNIWSFLPKMARTDSLESVLEISRMWTELDTSKQHILESLTIHLAESGRHQEALSIFSVIGWPSAAVFASLLCVLPYVYHSIVLDRALEMILSAQYISTQAELLSNVAEYLPDNKKKEILQYVLEASRGTEDAFRGERAGALAQLAPHLSEAEQSRVLIEVITAIKSEEIEEGRCVDIVISILPYVPEHQRGDVLRMILIIACSIETHYSRCMCAIKKLVPYLTPIANDQFYIWWTDMLHTLSKRDRSNLFCDLATLAPVIHALGGEDAILETYHAIQNVCTWWP